MASRLFAITCLLGLAASVTPASGQEGVEWTTSVSGGSRMDIPTFLEEGWVRALMRDGDDYGTAFEPEVFPVQVRQYRTTSMGRPYVYLAEGLGTQAEEITYSVDRDKLGVMSGYSQLGNRREVFYAMCRKVEVVYCFDIHYAAEAQTMFGPIVERIAASFR